MYSIIALTVSSSTDYAFADSMEFESGTTVLTNITLDSSDNINILRTWATVILAGNTTINGGISNVGNLTIDGNLVLNGVLNNNGNGVLNILPGSTVTNNGAFHNENLGAHHVIILGGKLIHNNTDIIDPTFEADETGHMIILATGEFLNFGSVATNGIIANFGILNNTNLLQNGHGPVYNYGTLINSGYFDIGTDEFELLCHSSIINTGSINGNPNRIVDCGPRLIVYEGERETDGLVEIGEASPIMDALVITGNNDPVTINWISPLGQTRQTANGNGPLFRDLFRDINDNGVWNVEAIVGEGQGASRVIENFKASGFAVPEYPIELIDFNGDGFADLPIGVPNEDIGNVEDAGAVNIIYGSPSGLSATFVPDQMFHQNSTGIEGAAESFDGFGFAVTASDFNADGYSDLAIGAPGEDIGTKDNAGVVNVIYGSPSGLSATAALPDQIWSKRTANIEDDIQEEDFFGIALATGDFNNDEYYDLAVGAHNEGAASGVVTIINGSPDGLSTSSAVPPQQWHQNSPGVDGTREQRDNLGWSLAVGDFNNDQYDDLAIGVPWEDTGSIENAGAVNVIYGSSVGLRASAAGDGTGSTDQLFHQNSPDVEGAAEENDYFGFSLVASDFNGDGYYDLVIGVPGEDLWNNNPIYNAGMTNLFYGSPSGLSTTYIPDQVWHQNSQNIRGMSEFGDYLGGSSFGFTMLLK